MNKQDSINLHTKESRTALTKMVMRLFGLWQISIAEQSTLLNRSYSTIRRYRNGGCFADNYENHERVSNLLNIHKSLRTLYPHSADLVYRWVSSRNRAFEGQAPIEVMKSGLDGLKRVRRYLEYQLQC